ncbi:MAG: hypothetical protein ACP5HQ_02105 [Thermoprotei archaeon]
MSSVYELKGLSDKVDYRILTYASYPHDVEVVAIVLTQSRPDDEVIEKLGKYGKVVKVFGFLNVVKVRGSAKNVVKIAEEPFVSYIMLDEVIPS